MKPVLWNLVIAVVTGLIMFFVGVWWTNRENRIQYLEFLPTASTDLLRSIKEIGDSVNFVVNDKSINNLSELSIHIFNSSNKDFENIPVYIDLFSPDGKDIRIFSSNHYDHNGSKESIEPLAEVSKSVYPGGERFGYNLKIANRSSEPVFRVRYLVEGTLAPRFEVQTNTKGVSVRQFVAKEEGFLSGNADPMFIGIAAVAVLFATIIQVISSMLSLRRSRAELRPDVEAIEKAFRADFTRERKRRGDVDQDK